MADSPLWLRDLVAWSQRACSPEYLQDSEHAIAALPGRYLALDPAGQRRALLSTLAAIVQEARLHTRAAGVHVVTDRCDAVIALCREGAAQDDPRWGDVFVEARTARAASTDLSQAEVLWSVLWAALAAAYRVDSLISDAVLLVAGGAVDAAGFMEPSSTIQDGRSDAADRIVMGILEAFP